MDFKVAGTAQGITALQMDIKVSGISAEIMRAALTQARAGRMHILEKMGVALSTTRANISKHAPRIVTIKIPVDKIRDVIGPGGKMIRSIIERTGVKIDVEDDGRVNVASSDEAAAAKAIGMIQELTATPELNKTYLGKVQRITDFGAFVEIMQGTDGLLHVSEIANYRVKDVRDELKEGQQVLVKVINIDPTGKIRLSRKALLSPEEGMPPATGAGGEGGGPAAASDPGDSEGANREGGNTEGGNREGGGTDGGNREGGNREGGDRRPRGGRDRGPRPPRRE
jgi:polyribonucleotide nucleotidyltransferase